MTVQVKTTGLQLVARTPELNFTLLTDRLSTVSCHSRTDVTDNINRGFIPLFDFIPAPGIMQAGSLLSDCYRNLLHLSFAERKCWPLKGSIKTHNLFSSNQFALHNGLLGDHRRLPSGFLFIISSEEAAVNQDVACDWTVGGLSPVVCKSASSWARHWTTHSILLLQA